MNKVQQYTSLMRYIEENPAVLAEHADEGRALLEQVEKSCLARNAQELSTAIDAFLALFMGDRSMRGFAPTQSQQAVEQFNSVRKATRSVLDKMQK
jgi:hypothetical protein